MVVIGDLLFLLMVLPHGIEPRSSGYRPGALPLSYGRNAGASSRTRTADRLHVGQVLWPLSNEALFGARSRTRTWECRCVGPMPWPLGEASAVRRVGVAAAHKQEWCTREDLNLHAARAAASEAAASAVSPRVHCGAATADRTPVSALPKRCPATGRLRPFTVVLAGGLEPPASRLRGECSAR